jgi:hypothetical protein
LFQHIKISAIALVFLTSTIILTLVRDSENIYRDLRHKNSIKTCCLKENMDVETIMDNRGTITVTLDDGYPVALNALSFENNSGYIKNTRSQRLMFQSSLDILNIHISGLRRDVWLSFQNLSNSKPS